MDEQLIPTLENQNQNIDTEKTTNKSAILKELRKKPEFEWMTEDEFIQAVNKFLKPVTEPLKEYATEEMEESKKYVKEELEEGQKHWETELGKLDPDKMGQIETYLKSPEFKRLALEITGGVAGAMIAPHLAGPVYLARAITIARPALQKLATRMIGAAVGEGAAGGFSQFFDPRESVVREVLRAAAQGIAGEGLGAVVNKAIAKVFGKNKKLIDGAEDAVKVIAKQKEKILKYPEAYSKRVHEAARTGNLTPALIQEGQTIDILENVAELSLIGSGGIRITREGAETVATSGIDDFVKQFKVVADDVEMGNLFQKLLKQDLDLFKSTSKGYYKAVDNALQSDKFANNFQVDLTNIKKWARTEMQNLGGKRQSASLKNFLQDIIDEKNYITFKRANTLRGDFLEIARDFTTEALGKKKGRLSAIASKEITAAMDNAAVPDSVKAILKKANTHYREGAEVFNDKLFSKIIENDPEIVYKSIVAAGDRPSLIKKTVEIINKRIKDPIKKDNLINAIRGQFLEDVMAKSSKSVSQYGTQLDANKLTSLLLKKKLAIKELFTPRQIADLKKFQKALQFSQGVLKKKGGLPGGIFIQMKQAGAVMQLVGGGYAAGTGSPGIAATIILGPAGLAKAFTSPKIIRLLTLGYKYNQNPTIAGRYMYQAVAAMASEGIITQNQADKFRKEYETNYLDNNNKIDKKSIIEELEKRGVPIPKFEQDSNIDEITETGDTSQLPPPQLQTPGINPASFDKTIMAQGTVDQTGLTSSELAFLDDEEKAMKLRQRGMA
tara:strand:- start:21 stop:2369 length:2349 start_codon:yes stop_codon:yes gene_type:complete